MTKKKKERDPNQPKPIFRKLTQIERFRVADLVKEHFDPAGERYFGEWSDRKVAEHAGVTIVAGVAEIRRALYGNIKRPDVRMAEASVGHQLAEIKAEIANFRGLEYATLVRKVDSLATQQAETRAGLQQVQRRHDALAAHVKGALDAINATHSILMRRTMPEPAAQQTPEPVRINGVDPEGDTLL